MSRVPTVFVNYTETAQQALDIADDVYTQTLRRLTLYDYQRRQPIRYVK